MLVLQQTATGFGTGTKMLVAGAGALSITFLLFAAMQQLIAVQGAAPKPVVATPVVALFEQVKDTDAQIKPPMPKMPELKPRELPPVTPTPVDNINISPGDFTIAGPALPKAHGEGIPEQRDRSATPIVRIEPRYPIPAARDGISGWVQLGFTIDETGAVTDVQVISAEPARVFDREAIAALRRWKYQPKILEGKAVKQTGMQVQLDFSLNNG